MEEMKKKVRQGKPGEDKAVPVGFRTNRTGGR